MNFQNFQIDVYILNMIRILDFCSLIFVHVLSCVQVFVMVESGNRNGHDYTSGHDPRC